MARPNWSCHGRERGPTRNTFAIRGGDRFNTVSVILPTKNTSQSRLTLPYAMMALILTLDQT